MNQTETGRRVKDHPEQRAVSTIQALHALGMSPGVVVLVSFCVVLVWFGGKTLSDYVDKSLIYNERMTTLVSGIQADLQNSTKSDQEFRLMAMQIMDRNTQQITRLETIVNEVGFLPIYKDANTGRTYIQTPKLIDNE